jgi:hypothetical protein
MEIDTELADWRTGGMPATSEERSMAMEVAEVEMEAGLMKVGNSMGLGAGGGPSCQATNGEAEGTEDEIVGTVERE